MPRPHTANPAKPASSVSTMSRCSEGTAFAFGDPWMSTNWARMCLTWLSFRNFLAAAGVIVSSVLGEGVATRVRASRLREPQSCQSDGPAGALRYDFQQGVPEI